MPVPGLVMQCSLEAGPIGRRTEHVPAGNNFRLHGVVQQTWTLAVMVKWAVIFMKMVKVNLKKYDFRRVRSVTAKYFKLGSHNKINSLFLLNNQLLRRNWVLSLPHFKDSTTYEHAAVQNISDVYFFKLIYLVWQYLFQIASPCVFSRSGFPPSMF